MEQVWEIMSTRLHSAKHRFNLRIHSFVLMSNHFHLLVSTPDANLSQAMAYFMKATSDELTFMSGRINQTYGGRHFRTIIEDYHYFTNSYKYFYCNPVMAGICQRPEEYPFSTLHGKLGKSHLLVPVEEDTLLFNDVDGILKWLNERPCDEDWKTMRDALRKSKFKLKMIKTTGKPHALETKRL